MRSFLSVAVLLVLVSGCAEPRSTVVIKPFTGTVPRIPGNYGGAPQRPSPGKYDAPPRAADPVQPQPSSSSSTSFFDRMEEEDRGYCSSMVTPTHSSYRWCNKHSYPTRDKR